MWYSPEFADGGTDMLRARAATSGRLRLRALRSYVAGASFADVSAATIGRVAVSATDITDSGAPGAPRDHTIGTKSVVLESDDAGTTLCWAITDETDSKVLLAGLASVPADKLPLRAGGTLLVAASVIARHLQA